MSIGFSVQNTPSGRDTKGCAVPNAKRLSATGVRKAEADASRFAGWERCYPVKGHAQNYFDERGGQGRPRAKAAGAGRSGLDLRDALQNSAQTGADLLGGLRA